MEHLLPSTCIYVDERDPEVASPKCKLVLLLSLASSESVLMAYCYIYDRCGQRQVTRGLALDNVPRYVPKLIAHFFISAVQTRSTIAQ